MCTKCHEVWSVLVGEKRFLGVFHLIQNGGKSKWAELISSWGKFVYWEERHKSAKFHGCTMYSAWDIEVWNFEGFLLCHHLANRGNIWLSDFSQGTWCVYQIWKLLTKRKGTYLGWIGKRDRPTDRPTKPFLGRLPGSGKNSSLFWGFLSSFGAFLPSFSQFTNLSSH